MFGTLLLFVLVRNALTATPVLKNKSSLSFTSDTSALSYRPVFIKSMVDDAIQSQSSLQLELSASQPVNFGFLKCGVYGFATISKVREARHVFSGKELENIQNMIDRSCSSDNHTSSFDLVVQSPEHTHVSLDFTTLTRNGTMSPPVESSPHLRCMYPLSVHFNLPANSSSLYPIQMKSLARRIMRTAGSRLRIRTSVDPSAPMKLSMDRCEYELEQKHFPFVEEKIYRKEHVKGIQDLLNISCNAEWLVDTVNVFVTSLSDVETSGFIKFDILYPEVFEVEVVKPKDTRVPLVSPIVGMPVNHKPSTSFDDYFAFSFCLIAAVILTTFVVLGARRSHSKRGMYHVANNEEFTYESELP